MATQIEAKGLVKSYGSQEILDGLDLAVGPGECVLLTGANGVGKTTLLHILAGLTGFDAGSVRLGGVACRRVTDFPRSKIGLLTHQPILYDELTVQENLVFYGKLYHIPEAGEAAEQLIHRLGLNAQKKKEASRLSRGMQQRLSIARILMHAPTILLLDEPFTALDQAGAAILETILHEKIQKGAAIVITAHEIERSGRFATCRGVIEGGRIHFQHPNMRSGGRWKRNRALAPLLPAWREK
jgi:heme exporter protein A